MSERFIIRDEETLGPFSLEDLKTQATDGRLLRTDFIGLADGGFPHIADAIDEFAFPALESEQAPPEGLIKPVLDSDDPDTFFARGLYYSRLGEYELAILYFDDVIDAYHSDELIYAYRGTCHQMLGNNVSAISDFSKQIELEPDNHDPYTRRSYLLLLEGDDIELSLSDALEACRLGPEDSPAHVSLALVYEHLEESKQASDAFSAAIRFDPTNHSAYAHRGVYLHEQGEHSKALRDFDIAIEIEPTAAWYYEKRGWANAGEDEYEAAMADFTKALELGLTISEVFNGRGCSLELLGRYEDAIADQNEAIRLEPDFAEAYYDRHECYLALGDAEQAESDKAKAFELGYEDE